MRNFNQFCRQCVAAFVLMMALACSAFAGDVQYPNIISQPPATTNGDIQNPTVTSSTDTADGDVQFPGVTVVAMSLLESALSIF